MITNYNMMKSLSRDINAINFRLEGDPAYPYMILNNDQNMMMNAFVNRILGRFNQQVENIKR